MISQEVAPTSVVVVGGLAVRYWTPGLATDIDVLMPQTIEICGKLEDLGLVRSEGERHWQLPGAQIAIEAPAAKIAEHEVSIRVESPTGLDLEILSPADLVAWRLDEFIATGHPEVAADLVLLMQSPHFVEAQLVRSAAVKGISPALPILARLADTWSDAHESSELQDIAREMSRACYDRGHE